MPARSAAQRAATAALVARNRGNPGNPEVIVVQAPRRTRGRRTAGRVGSAIAKAAWDEKHTIAALLAAGVAGAARRYDWQVPTLGDLPAPLVWGLGFWAFGRFQRNQMAQHVATGLLSVGLYEGIAYTAETRAQIDTLVTTQAETEATTTSTLGMFESGHHEEADFDG